MRSILGRYHRWLPSIGLGVLLLLLNTLSGVAAQAQGSRRQNTTLKMPMEPGGLGYEFVDALGLQFDAPVALATPPGETNRLFVVELGGRVTVVTNLAAPTRTVLLDLGSTTSIGPEEGMLALAFHPNHAANGRLFVYRTVQGFGEREMRISEFRVSPQDPNRIEPGETVILSQRINTSSHLGGDLRFGPDGYLYGSIGDGAMSYTNSQQITGGLYSAIYRIDVDGRPDSLPPHPRPDMVQNYRIPADNPFVGASSFLGQPVDPSVVRTEFWSVGLRNPFRFSFDSLTGDLWLGDVGEESWESIFLSRRGANHGWAFLEGTRPGLRSAEMPADFLSNPAHGYVPPVFTYDHNVGRSALGGLVYRGKTLTQLYGLYIFADHSWGHVIALATPAQAPATVLPVTWKPYLTAIGTDPRDGEILATDLSAGRVWKLVYNTNFVGQPLPQTLAETGVFEDLRSLTPAPGFVPYSLNQSFWSDDAVKRRWFCLPETNQLFSVSIHDAWSAPPGAVWVKHFDIDTVVGDPGSRRRLETRLLVRNARGVYGVTYRWEGSNSATLVPEEGAEELLVRQRAGKPARQSFTQKWRYPSRTECLVCHTPQAGYSLGFKTSQLNCEADLGGTRTNQLLALAAAGYLDSPLPRPRDLPALAAPTDTRYSLEWRARSYLEANCASCHRPGGTALGHWDARTITPTALAGLINGPLINPRGDADNRVIKPGDSLHSVLLQRMASRGTDQMPPLGSSIPDPVGVELLQQWIGSIQNGPPLDPPAVLSVVSSGGRARIHIRQPANRRLQIELSPFLEVSSWQPLELPESVVDYPAEPRNVVLEYPLGDDSLFFRVQSLAP